MEQKSKREEIKHTGKRKTESTHYDRYIFKTRFQFTFVRISSTLTRLNNTKQLQDIFLFVYGLQKIKNNLLPSHHLVRSRTVTARLLC